MAEAVSRDPDTALRVHTREELGVDPFELPSAVVAGVSSLVAFSAGALIPLLPYLAGLSVLAVALGLSAVALLAGGMVVGRLTGRPMLRSGLRQLALGGVAVAVTFTVGSLIAGRPHRLTGRSQLGLRTARGRRPIPAELDGRSVRDLYREIICTRRGESEMRKIWGAAGLAALALAVSACGSSGSSSAASTPAAAAGSSPAASASASSPAASAAAR